MGNGNDNEAERKELSGPGASLNGNHIIAANSFLKPVTGNTKQFALYFTDWLGIIAIISHCLIIINARYIIMGNQPRTPNITTYHGNDFQNLIENNATTKLAIRYGTNINPKTLIL
jgi:hypothetical protein